MSFPNIYTTKNTQNANFFSMGKVKGSYEFDSKAVNDLHKFVASGKASQYCFVERKTVYFKLLWDLDMSDKLFDRMEENKTDFDKFWKFVIEKMVSVLRIFIKGDDKTFQYIYSDREDIKHKLHLYFPNIVLNCSQAMALREKVIEKLAKNNTYKLTKADYESILDRCVFQANGLRILFQAKPGNRKSAYKINKEKSTVNIATDDKVQHLELTSIRTNNQTHNVEFNLSENDFAHITEIQEAKKVTQRRMVKEGKENEIDKEDLDVLLTTEYGMKFVESLANNLSMTRISTYDTWLKFIFLCRNYGWKDLAHKISKKDKTGYNEKAVNKRLRETATGNPITIASLIKWSKTDKPVEHEKIWQDRERDNLIMEKIICAETEKTFEDYADHTYEEKYVQVLDYNAHDTFIIKAATGTGKTETIIKTIRNIVKDDKNANSKLSITVLASRIVLAENIAGRFKARSADGDYTELNMNVYTDIENKSGLKNERRLIQTPDSLSHMIDDEGRVIYPDILFIDEIESLYNYVITSGTLKERRRLVFTILNAYIKNAKWVFLVDSNVTTKMCDYIKKLRGGKNVQVIFNRKKTNETTYHLVPNDADWMGRLVQYVNDGKKVYVGSDSKAMTDQLEERFKSYKKVKVYNSDTDDESKKALGDVNKVWKEYDIVICSPTILYGVDFNQKHFDYIFGFYQATIEASSVYQQLNRVRETTSKEAYVYIDKRFTSSHPMPTTAEKIQKYLFRYSECNMNIITQLSLDETEPCTLAENLFNELFIHFEIEKNKCTNDYIQQLATYLKEFGGKFYKLSPRPMSKEVKQKITQESKEIKIRVKTRINNTLIEKSKKRNEAKGLMNKQSKTTEEKTTLDANKLCTLLNLTELDENILEALGHKKNAETLVNSFTYFHVSKGDNIDNSVAVDAMKKSLIKSANELLWGSDGFLSTKEMYVLQNSKLSDEQIRWWSKNKKDVIRCFGRIRIGDSGKFSKAQLFNVVNIINERYFGGFVTETKPMLKQRMINGKRQGYRVSKIDNHKWIELFLNSKSQISVEVLNQLKPYSAVKCAYADLHKNRKETIGEMIAERMSNNFEDYIMVSDEE